MNAEEFAALYEAERPIVFAYLLKAAKNWHVAEDITSQVFLAAWEARERYEARGVPYRHYLKRIAHWQHGLYWKKEKRWRKRIAYYPYLGQHVEALAHDGGINAVLDKVNNALAYALLSAALRKMRERPLRVIALRYGLCLPEKEAARRMGMSRDAFHSCQRGAIERLQQILLGKEPTWTTKNARKRQRHT